MDALSLSQTASLAPAPPQNAIIVNGPLDFYGLNGVLYANGSPFHVKGLNWYGTEGSKRMLEGLDRRSLGSLLDFIAGEGFNAMRLLLNMQDFRDDAQVPEEHFSALLTPELEGVSYRQMLRVIMQEAGKRNLLVLLACHRLRRKYTDEDEWPDGWDGLWFDDAAGLSLANVTHLWQQVAETYCSEWNLFGVDVFNEPWAGRWGTGGSNDWGIAAAQMGNGALMRCPRLLVFVQGAGESDEGCWGESFDGVHQRMVSIPGAGPVDLTNMSKLVLGPHVYGPSLYGTPALARYMPDYFVDPTFPRNMVGIWEALWGFTSRVGSRPPLVLTEAGGNMDCCNFPSILQRPSADTEWHIEFLRYLRERDAALFYFCLNPLSKDTGGILETDWRTPVRAKLELLKYVLATPVRWAASPPPVLSPTSPLLAPQHQPPSRAGVPHAPPPALPSRTQPSASERPAVAPQQLSTAMPVVRQPWAPSQVLPPQGPPSLSAQHTDKSPRPAIVLLETPPAHEVLSPAPPGAAAGAGMSGVAHVLREWLASVYAGIAVSTQLPAGSDNAWPPKPPSLVMGFAGLLLLYVVYRSMCGSRHRDATYTQVRSFEREPPLPRPKCKACSEADVSAEAGDGDPDDAEAGAGDGNRDISATQAQEPDVAEAAAAASIDGSSAEQAERDGKVAFLVKTENGEVSQRHWASLDGANDMVGLRAIIAEVCRELKLDMSNGIHIKFVDADTGALKTVGRSTAAEAVRNAREVHMLPKAK